MSGAKETPRQKMIGMMYLVLTALLALNVSVEVLDAFSTVNEGLENTTVNITNKINDYYDTFEQQYNKQPEKTEKYWKRAQEIRTKTDELVNYIEKDIKLELLKICNGIKDEAELYNPEKEEDIIILNPEEVDLSKNRRIFHRINFENLGLKDQHDPVTSFMITYGNATNLRSKIDEYRKYIVEAMEAEGINNYDDNVALKTDRTFKTSKGEEVNWEYKNFNHVIVPAAFSVINGIIAEIQTTEYDAIAELFKNIGASDFKFNTLEAKVFPKTTYVLKGQDYEADVFIVASDDTREFNAKYAKGVKDFSKANSNAIQDITSQKGIVKIKLPATTVGEQSFAGIIEMKNPQSGEIEPYPFNASYTVAPPSANVTPTKMNVMYRGLENPISISAPGFTGNQIKVSATNNVELTKVNDVDYFVKPGIEGHEAIITVTATTNDNKAVKLGEYKFRLKDTPQATPVINGKTRGEFTRSELLAAGGFYLTMPDFDFEGYIPEILSYDIIGFSGGYGSAERQIQGRNFNDKAKNLIKKSTSITIENIKVKEPSGRERVLDIPIKITIK